MNKQGRRVILIYKANMYTKASLDPERCTHKSDEKVKRIIFTRGGGGTEPNTVEHQNRFAPLRQQGSESGDRDSEALNSGILRGGSASEASSSRGSRGRDPIPLTLEIVLLLDRLEHDKGKQARLLTEHLTGQRTLPCTEQEL